MTPDARSIVATAVLAWLMAHPLSVLVVIAITLVSVVYIASPVIERVLAHRQPVPEPAAKPAPRRKPAAVGA